MNFYFSTLILPPSPQLKAKELLKLVGLNNNELENISPALLDIITNPTLKPLRSLDEIFQNIEQGKTDDISYIEWIHCLNFQKGWEQYHLGRSQNISENIWNFAKNTPWLKHHLLYNLVLHLSQIENFPEFSNFLIKQVKNYTFQRNSNDQDILEIIKTLQDNNNYAKQLAKISSNKLQTPRQLFVSLDLPQKIPEINHALSKTCSQFIYSRKRSDKVKWLISCLEEMNSEQQVKGVNVLLENISREESINYPQLVDWIKQHFSPSLSHSLWKQLSSRSKTVLRQWMGAANYGDFKQLINLILNRLSDFHFSEGEGYEGMLKNQLERRRDFWSNYSDRFERIRILLPPKSVAILKSDLHNQNITIFQEDGSEPTEVCIFDFGDWFIVEFFRGRASEMRLLSKTTDLEKKLFEDDNLSIKKLRFYGGETHDHKYCWQGDCVQWLKEKHIYPNPGITYFEGLSPTHGRYDPNRGLPPISQNKRKIREEKLEKWRKDIQQLEAEAKLSLLSATLTRI